MLQAAGLDWSVETRPIVAKGLFDIDIPEMKATVRMDTNQVLGVVSQSYSLFQNQEMVSFFETLATGHKISYEVAGGLGNGEKVWVLAKIPDLSFAIKGDEMLSYMLIRNGHDGKMKLVVHPTSIRTVCQNTMNMASAEFLTRRKLFGKSIHAGYAIRHSKNMAKAVQDALAAYGKCLEDAKQTRELFEILADKPVTDQQVRAYFIKMIAAQEKAEADEKEKASKMAETRMRNRLDLLQQVWNAPTNQTGTKGTAFALVNTITEYVDHHRATRCTDEAKTDSTCRFESSMFGNGVDMKQKALLEAMELVGV
jgi:phage/plasmid-like protein (TIGR03299 family)